jgi:hypothetical protein
MRCSSRVFFIYHGLGRLVCFDSEITSETLNLFRHLLGLLGRRPIANKTANRHFVLLRVLG